MKYFLFPLTRPTVKKWSYHFFFFFFFFHDLEIIFFFVFCFDSPKFIPSHKRTFLDILLFFHTIPLQNSKLNTVLNI